MNEERVTTLRELLAPILEVTFPDRGLRTSAPPEPVAAFPSVCAEVGDLLTHDDGDEFTVIVENVTHFHISTYEQEGTDEERRRIVCEEVVDFARELFADRVLLYMTDDGRRSGVLPFDGCIPDNLPEGSRAFVWTHQL